MEFERVYKVVDPLFVKLRLLDREGNWDGGFKFFHELGKERAENRVENSVAGETGLKFVDVFFAGMEFHLAGGRTVGCEVWVNDSGHRIV
jgi:hypothetical protein